MKQGKSLITFVMVAIAAALCVYWIANNLFTMVQEIFLTWYMDKYHPLPKEEPKKKKKKQPKQEEG